jgi:hypothetical protein
MTIDIRNQLSKTTLISFFSQVRFLGLEWFSVLNYSFFTMFENSIYLQLPLLIIKLHILSLIVKIE